ncbi:zinc-binding dehydrogenase [Sneathiella sp. P13V-1]|uniref:NADPH:quinone oxidoreductase family protein n=1 Tax=Sneathiella sp. P13V-1 TaxID=2697366 RepID=UPI00187B434D|nr:NADPH:quinone oxidoreductase family protein [Sneathiella sp. P13V-1]MBE7636726.1 zinc-binding dehydrogenase [Sneathiella sp. P13V-1]
MENKNKNASTRKVIDTPASIVDRLEGPQAISQGCFPLPTMSSKSVLVKVKAAALNFPDLLMTYGKYQHRPELPFVPGMEGAGDVIETGSDVKNVKVGDRVMFKGKTGACAQHAVVTEENVTLAPESLTCEQAAAFAVTFQTAYVSLVRRGRLQKGETVLISGAGGGVGQASVAVAKALGATVIAAASSTEKLKIAAESGADFLIDYSQSDWKENILRYTNGAGADLFLDPVGGQILETGIKALRRGGRVLLVGFASGAFGQVDLRDLRDREINLIGVRAGEYGRRNPEAGRSAWLELVKLTEEAELKPYIGQVWKEDQVAEALTAMEQRQVSGKQIVLI